MGLENIVKNRMHGSAMGFNADVVNSEVDLADTMPDDIMRFGMIPEFVGRFPNWVNLEELTLDELTVILTDVKNSYVDQYKWLFGVDGVELEFSKESLLEIAQHAKNNKTGARGLHGEMERILMPHMFDLRNYVSNGITRVVIDVDLVNNPTTLLGE